MQTINLMIQGGTAAVTAYHPVPSRGVIVSVKAAFGKTVAADDTVNIKRDTTSVNLITTGAVTAGKVYTGTPDTTNKQLIFDPASTTEAEKMLKIEVSTLETLLTPVNLTIEYDDSAYVTQAALEA